MTVLEKRPGADDLLAAQEALQVEAAAVLTDLGVFEQIRPIGRPIQTGSSALGLMVARDIDVTTVCPSLELEPVFDVGRVLAGHPRVRSLSFRNDSGRWNVDPAYPDGLYWMVEYVTEDGVSWKLDLWFILEGTTQFDLEHLRTLPPRLTRQARVAILRIKHARKDRPPAFAGPATRSTRRSSTTASARRTNSSAIWIGAPDRQGSGEPSRDDRPVGQARLRSLQPSGGPIGLISWK
jgi:hypothetical protein